MLKHYWEYGQQDKDTRSRYNTGDIFENAAKCFICDDYIRSNHLHDYKECSCGNIAVDGGSWYARRIFKDRDKYEDIVVMYEDAEE